MKDIVITFERGYREDPIKGRRTEVEISDHYTSQGRYVIEVTERGGGLMSSTTTIVSHPNDILWAVDAIFESYLKQEE